MKVADLMLLTSPPLTFNRVGYETIHDLPLDNPVLPGRDTHSNHIIISEEMLS
jgi:hypothetical protein